MRKGIACVVEAVEARRMLSGDITITTQPTNQTVQVGSTATFTASATGTAPVTVQWQYRAASATNSAYTPDTTDVGNNTNTLTVTGSTTDSGYTYEALFTDSQGSLATNPASLTVTVPLTITMEPVNQTTYIGGSATFTAAVETSTTPTQVQWQESTDNGYTFNNVGSPTIINSTQPSSSYTVTNAAVDTYQDQYQAVFNNSQGSITTYPASLNVSGGVALTQQSYSQAVFAGGTATFSAAAAGITAPTVQWSVSTNNGASYTNVNGGISTTSGTTTSTTLSVPSTNAGNLYEATFINASGSVTTHPAILDVNLNQFTEGDLVVLRLGDAAYPDLTADEGAQPPTSSQVPIYLDEYTKSGTYVGSVAVPSSGADALTLPGAGDSQHEGDLALSTNGAILTFAGYQVPEGSADANLQGGDDQPVIGYIDNGASTLNTTTIVNSYGPGSDNPYIRGAFTNYGNTFWTFGKYAAAPRQSQSINGNGGLEYVTGTGPTATTTDVETYADWRYVTVINGQMYAGVGSSSVGTHGPYLVDNTSANVSAGILTEPDTDQGQDTTVNTLLGSYPGGQSASSLAMVGLPGYASQNGLNVLYTVGDQTNAGITKYDWNGSAWVLTGYQQKFNASLGGGFNPTGILAVEDPTNPNWVDITVSGEDGVFTYVDKSGPTGAIPSYAFTELAAAPADGEFRGMSVAPLFWESPTSVASWNAYTDTLTVTGPTTIIADPGSDEPIIQANGSSAVLTINPTSDSQVHLGGLSLTNGASAIVTSLGAARTSTNHMILVLGLPGATTAPLFNIDSTSDLNLTDNDLVDHDGNLAAITSLLKSGFNAGSGYWNGDGIQSSVAAGAANKLTALGVAQPASAGTFDNLSVGTSDVEIRYTYYGDANLDGHVDGSDYSDIDNGFLRHLTGWANGDFNYDGVVNGSDYTLIDNAFNRQGASEDTQIATPDSAIAQTETKATIFAPSQPIPAVASDLFSNTPLKSKQHYSLFEQLGL